jgi:hypothetical protein
VSGANPAVRPSLDDGKNNSRASEPPDTEQSTLTDHLDRDRDGDRDDDVVRYDCRTVYRNMELEASDGDTAGFRCNQWACYCCAHRMRMNLIEELERLIDERPELRRLLTLTLDPAAAPADQDEQHRYLTERFNALRTELNDRYDGLSYVWIREEGESGNPHLHLLVDRYMAQQDLSRMAERVGLGRVVDIRRVNARNAAKYLTKYLTKGSMAGLPKGIRRYGSSADLDLNVRGGGDDDRDWRLMMDDYETRRRGSDEPLRRQVTKTDLWLQKQRGGPVGLDPPGGGRGSRDPD